MSVERVNYFDGQYLRAEDFKAEQAYQIGMRRRHNIAQHTWGIVQGLDLRLIEGDLWVMPGIAVDVFGREIVLEAAKQLRLDMFVDADVERLEAWIEYSTFRSNPAPEGYGSKGTNGYYRIVEMPEITVSRPTPESSPTWPAGTTSADLNFDATSVAPEDRRWPVFLGGIAFDRASPQAPYKVDSSGRPYAGLVGESIDSPSGSTRVQIGMGEAADSVRFAVFMPAVNADPVLHIEKDGKLTATGEMTLEGSLTLTGGGLEFGEGSVSSPQPWRIYRSREQGETGKFHDDLRIEMGSDGQGRNQIVFGSWSVKEKKFKPSLTVADDGTVTVAGNLVVQGQLRINPDEIVPGKMAPQAEAVVAAAAASAAGVTAEVHSPSFEEKLRDVVKHLEHKDHLDTFAQLIKQDFGHLHSAIKSALEHEH